MIPRLYRYVGPKRIGDRAGTEPLGWPIHWAEDVRRWVGATGQSVQRDGSVVATFVVDEDGRLMISDRSSEHVACAGGGKVRSAGEMTFLISKSGVEVIAVSNQSTGYCPEPESWPSVRTALVDAGLACPELFDPECVFRRCANCGQINVIKGDWFRCQVCSRDLPADYNLQDDTGDNLSSRCST
jgi:hypothetical protein